MSPTPEKEDNPLVLSAVRVPASLLARVEDEGVRLLSRRNVVRSVTPRERVVDLLMTGFCVAHCVWIARIVRLLP